MNSLTSNSIFESLTITPFHSGNYSLMRTYILYLSWIVASTVSSLRVSPLTSPTHIQVEPQERRQHIETSRSDFKHQLRWLYKLCAYSGIPLAHIRVARASVHIFLQYFILSTLCDPKRRGGFSSLTRRTQRKIFQGRWCRHRYSNARPIPVRRTADWTPEQWPMGEFKSICHNPRHLFLLWAVCARKVCVYHARCWNGWFGVNNSILEVSAKVKLLANPFGRTKCLHPALTN